jgi:5-methylthioadenosine/S-adenosylhomocysteine deaminase
MNPIARCDGFGIRVCELRSWPARSLRRAAFGNANHLRPRCQLGICAESLGSSGIGRLTAIVEVPQAKPHVESCSCCNGNSLRAPSPAEPPEVTVTTLVRGGRVLRRRERSYVADHADIVIDGSTIREILSPQSTDVRAYDSTIDASGRLIAPGLINAHTHSYGNLARGTFDALTLEAWVPYASAVTVRRTWEEGYVSAMLGAIESVRTGTTAVLDHLAGSAEAQAGALQAYGDIGLRVTMAPMVADRPAHETVGGGLNLPASLRRRLDDLPTPKRSDIVASQRELFESWHHKDGLIAISVGPSGAQRCSEELLLDCVALAREFDAGIHAHLLETRAQQQYAHSLYGKSMVAYLEELGLLSERFSGAHAVWCTTEDLEIIAKTGAVLVHNPWSNLTLGSGTADLPRWRQSGVVGGLGTDGANCGGNLNMFEAMRLATALHRSGADAVERWTTPADALTLATEGSAQALHSGSRIGRLEPGFEADLVIIDLESSTYLPESDVVNQLIQGENGKGIESVLIGGRTVMECGQLVNVDESKIFQAAQNMLANLLARNADLIESAKLQERHLLEISRSAHMHTSEGEREEASRP